VPKSLWAGIYSAGEPVFVHLRLKAQLEIAGPAIKSRVFPLFEVFDGQTRQLKPHRPTK
jgi:hypothetical protein